MKECSGIKADWEKLVAMAEIFENPTTFAYHAGKNLIVNGREIIGEVTHAVEAYKVQAWYDFGYNIGKASAKLIIGEDEPQFLQ